MNEVTLYDVYTDGSFHNLDGYKDKVYGAIYVPLFDEKEWQFSTDNKIYVESRNVGGEILAAEFAVSLIAQIYDNHRPHGYVDINLWYDYEGVGKWITGEWRCKKLLTQRYKQFISEIVSTRNLRVYPHWICGHRGNPGNERADALATNAYQSERCYDANSFVERVLK